MTRVTTLRQHRWTIRILAAALAVGGTAIGAAAQPAQQGQPRGMGHGMGQGMGHGMGHGMGGDASHQQDMEVFHFLLDRGKDIRRTITVRPDGVETITESDDAAVVDQLRVHVVSMSARVSEKRPIHMRDPLFAEVFKHAALIEMSHENTPKGVRVVETSKDPYVARLIQAHAEVVSLFIRNGRAEAMKNHEVPAR